MNAQTKNTKTAIIKIFGNCGMCKETIENAGNIKKSAKVDWNKDTKMATISYDSLKTTKEEILKRIALAGYDNEEFLAPDDTYAQLAECCQYNRMKKMDMTKPMESHSMHQHSESDKNSKVTTQKDNQLKVVFDNYFTLKDALVKTDGYLASTNAKKLLLSINAIDMAKLSNEEHTVWMKVMKDLTFDTEHIEETKDAGHQREHFITLSDNMYQLMKISEQATTTYYQHCPMANGGKGANWLSKETEIKNPYYGSKMMSCGKVIETIK
jgi:copper chaperone CopZ